MKFSIIIPVAKKDTRYLRRCLLSLQDQDYNDWEALVVPDGHHIGSPVKDDRVVVMNLIVDNLVVSGASASRNRGAKHAQGDILFFFDADCVLFPGMLSLIKDKFTREKCDFVYSGYRFNHSTLSVFPSRPFDPYLLESANYISTMSPMKREVYDKVGGFRCIPYFQDWDFWLRAVKCGFRGHYLKDFIFQTEVPNQTSISGSGKYAYEEKVAKIELLNNIEKRDVCITTLSAPYQAIERAKVLNARYIGLHSGTSLCQKPSQFPYGIKTVILQGFFPETAAQHMAVFPEGSKKIINWIGTDVWQLRNKFNWTNIKFIKNEYLSKIDVHLCNSPELQKELDEVGVYARVVYQPLTEQVIKTPLPKKPTVSAYCSHGHPLHSEFYLRDLAQAMPDVNFVFFGTQLQDTQDKNIRFMGFVPIQDAINVSTMHLRITQHDGFPHTPIYFAMAGRRVLTNFKMKYCDYIEGYPNANTWGEIKKNIVTYIRQNLEKPTVHDINDVMGYYLELCSPAKYKQEMQRVIDEVQNDGSNADLQQCAVASEVS